MHVSSLAIPKILICAKSKTCPSAELATTSGVVQADTFVIAAGLGTPELARMAGIEVPLDNKPATLNVYTAPAPPLLRHMLLSGGFLSCQAASRLSVDTSQGEDCADEHDR